MHASPISVLIAILYSNFTANSMNSIICDWLSHTMHALTQTEICFIAPLLATYVRRFLFQYGIFEVQQV